MENFLNEIIEAKKTLDELSAKQHSILKKIYDQIQPVIKSVQPSFQIEISKAGTKEPRIAVFRNGGMFADKDFFIRFNGGFLLKADQSEDYIRSNEEDIYEFIKAWVLEWTFDVEDLEESKDEDDEER